MKCVVIPLFVYKSDTCLSKEETGKKLKASF